MRPAGKSMDERRIAALTSAKVRPKSRRRRGSASMAISGGELPSTFAWEMPFIAIRSSRTVRVALNKSVSLISPQTATLITSNHCALSGMETSGGSISSGKELIRFTRVLICSSSSLRLRLEVALTTTHPLPSSAVDSMESTPGSPSRAASMGSTTAFSTSAGLPPRYATSMCTSFISIAGCTSSATFSFADQTPHARIPKSRKLAAMSFLANQRIMGRRAV